MANPKRKLSKSKRDMRRGAWMNGLKQAAVTECSNCGEPKMPHRACPNCGFYKGQIVTTPNE